MKPVLKEKIIRNGRLAEELERSEGFKELSRIASEKKELILKEVLSSKSFDEFRHRAGFIEGLDFLVSVTDQWSQRARTLRKKIKN